MKKKQLEEDLEWDWLLDGYQQYLRKHKKGHSRKHIHHFLRLVFAQKWFIDINYIDSFSNILDEIFYQLFKIKKQMRKNNVN